MRNVFYNTMTRSLSILTVLALLCGALWAQGGTGELNGVVTDPSGAVVTSTPITLTNDATGDKRTTVTSQAGTYRFAALPVVGSYTLEVAAKSFKTAKVANIVVTVGAVTNQDVHLELGANTDQVTVEAGVQNVQTSDASLSGLIDRRVWQQMPLETRDQNSFINLLAGAVQGNIALNAANGGTDRGAAVNGTRSGGGNYLVEGFDNNDQGLGGAGSLASATGGANTTISPDAIQEYRVIEHNFSAEYGKAGGFVTDTVLKSGTNQWHGSLFEYNRIQALAANSFFSNRAGIQDSLVRNQFGGSIGGPIVKDKTFFYFTTEFHRLRTSAPLTGTTTTPDFLNFVNSGAFEAFNETDPNGLCMQVSAAQTGTASGCPGALVDAGTLGPIFQQLASTEPFPLCTAGSPNCAIQPGANISRNLWSIKAPPVGSGFPNPVVAYPVPIYGTLTLGASAPLDQARYTAKVDHKISNNDSLNIAYLYDNADTTTQFAGGGAGGTGFGVDLPNHGRAMNAGITWSHTFSPTVLNQARVAYTRHTADFPGDAGALAAGAPSIFTAFDPLTEGFGNASNLPQFFTENEFNYKDDLSVTKGKHNFKGGASYTRTRNGSSFQSDINGLFVPYTVEDLVTDFKYGDNADLAIYGAPYYGSWYYAQASIDPTKNPAVRPDYYRGFRANELATYFQDDWRIHPRLTLNLGIRWEYFGPPHNFKPGLDSNFYTGAPVTPILCGGLPCTNPFLPANDPAFAAFASGTLQQKNNDIWHKDTNNWAPRFGFAWDTLGNQKFVVRGGFGVAYDRMFNNIFENIRFNPPFFCFCTSGAFFAGTAVGGGNFTPGVYGLPFTNVAAFNTPLLFGGGIPKTSPRAIDQNLVTAYYEQANFGFQYEIAKNLVLESNYVNTLGRKLVGISNLNTFPGRRAGLGSAARPNPLVNNINLRTNGFSSNYNALQTTLRKTFSSGLQFNLNYTYAKAMDQISDAFTPRGVAANLNPQDSLNPGLDNGPADFDVKHRFVASYSYDLPFMKTNRWVGGWSLSGVITVQSGVPFSLIDGSGGYDLNGNGTFNDRIAYIGGGSIKNALTGGSPANGFFDPAAFAPIGTVNNPSTIINCPLNVNQGLWCQGSAAGQTSRNTLYGPGYFNWDFSVAKRFKITESAGLQFQANFFNLLNHSNFALPNSDFNGNNFGLSTATFLPGQGGARVTQLALRFDF